MKWTYIIQNNWELRKTYPHTDFSCSTLLTLTCFPHFAISCVLTGLHCLPIVLGYHRVCRILFVDGRIVYIYIGACTLVNAKACHFFQCNVSSKHSLIFAFLAAHVELMGQSVYLLLISFICRVWMFKAKYKINLDIKTILERIRIAAAIAALFTVFSIVYLSHCCFNSKNESFQFAFYLAGSYEVDGYANQTVSALVMFGEYNGTMLPLFSIISIFTTLTLGFGAIFVLRRRLFACLRNMVRPSGEARWSETLKSSAADRTNQNMIYNSLTAQMMLPLAYIFGIALWLVDVFGIVHSRTLQRAVFMVNFTC